jgi:hypothetical protein
MHKDALSNPFTAPRTLIVDQDNEQLAWIDGGVWPTIGSAIELYEPNRDAIVRAVRLQLSPGQTSTILIDVHDPRDAGTTIARPD